MKECPNCSHINEDDATNCVKCDFFFNYEIIFTEEDNIHTVKSSKGNIFLNSSDGNYKLTRDEAQSLIEIFENNSEDDDTVESYIIPENADTPESAFMPGPDINRIKETDKMFEQNSSQEPKTEQPVTKVKDVESEPIYSSAAKIADEFAKSSAENNLSNKNHHSPIIHNIPITRSRSNEEIINVQILETIYETQNLSRTVKKLSIFVGSLLVIIIALLIALTIMGRFPLFNISTSDGQINQNATSTLPPY